VEDGFGGGDTEIAFVSEVKGFEVLAGAAVESVGLKSDEELACVLGEIGDDRKSCLSDAVFVGVDMGFGEDAGRIRGRRIFLRVAGVELYGNIGDERDAIRRIGGDVESGRQRNGEVIVRDDEIKVDGVAGDANVEMALLGAAGRSVRDIGGIVEILEALVVVVEKVSVIVGEIQSGVEFIFGVEIAFLRGTLLGVPLLLAVIPGAGGFANDAHMAA